MLAVVLAASNITAASDTLRITSTRVINTCSGEQRWLILCSIGEVYASDSLMSFDITIGFDTALFRPTDGLWLGTLADKMRFSDISPFLNLRVPGEMRVGAFTINTPVKGNEPLFAVAGDFKGTCSDSDTLSFPYYPEFNSEFKVVTRHLVTDTIIGVAIPSQRNDQGSTFDKDTITLQGKDSVASIPISIRTNELAGAKTEIEIQLESPLPAKMDSITFSNGAVIDSIKLSNDGRQATVYRTADTASIINGTVYLSSVTDDTLSTHIITDVTAVGTCLCITPSMKDTAVVENIKQPVVSVEQDLHEGSGIRIALERGIIIIQNHHGLPGEANLVDVLGRTVRTAALQSGNSTQLSLENLPSGIYYMVVVTGGDLTVRKIGI